MVRCTQPSSPRADEDTYVAPRNEIEQDIARIFTELLRVARVGIHDDFFALGVHSLLATQAVSRLREAFQVEVPLPELFDSRTVANLAEHVLAAQAARLDPAELGVLMAGLEDSPE